MVSRFARRYSRNYLVETGWMYLFIMPWILGFLIWTAGPMLYSIYLSFTKYDILTPPQWAGLKNYSYLINDRLFWQSLKVTTIYSFVSLPLGLFGSLAIAVLMNQKVPGMSLWRTVYYLPAVVSGVPVAILWRWLFNPEFGIINWLLWSLFHIEGPMWLYSPQWVLPAFIVMSLWGVGGGMVIYLASLQGVPTEIYEAAELDGANARRKFLSVTIPMISPVIFFNLVMGIIGSFQTFTSSYVMTAGGPSNASLFYLLYLYRNAWQYLKMGYASALAWILFVIIMALTLLTFRSAGGWVYYEGGIGVGSVTPQTVRLGAARPREHQMPAWRGKAFRTKAISYASLVLILMGAAAVLVPFIWMVSTAFKTDQQVYLVPPRWIPNPWTLDNFTEGLTVLPFGTFFKNTLIITLGASLGRVLSSSFVAFGFARLRGIGRDFWFMVLLATMMLPGQVTMIPVYLIFQRLGSAYTFKPLIIPAYFGGAFSVFLVRQFYLTHSRELDDAARIDGCGYFGIYWRLMLPMSRPVIAALAIFAFMDHWNDFFGPLIYLTDQHKFTVPLALSFFQSTPTYTGHLNWLMAGSLLALLPCLLIFFFAQRVFIQGIVFTGVKG